MGDIFTNAMRTFQVKIESLYNRTIGTGMVAIGKVKWLNQSILIFLSFSNTLNLFCEKADLMQCYKEHQPMQDLRIYWTQY